MGILDSIVWLQLIHVCPILVEQTESAITVNQNTYFWKSFSIKVFLFNSAAPGLYSCSCNCGWTGTNCNSQVNQCVNTPCLNGGLCQNVAPCGYQCICPPGYTGTKCDIVINNCASNPCSSNGVCLNSNFGYSCSCSPGWTGSLCQIQINVMQHKIINFY